MFSLFTKKISVDSVLESFNQTINDLQDVAANNTEAANLKVDEAERLNNEAQVHLDESARASEVAQKLIVLVS
jgi:hypothetical protein